jgi:hypothetical protein
MLYRARVLTIVRELVSRRVPKHVAVDQERKTGSISGASDHPLIASNAKGCQALGHEDIHALRGLTLELAQSPKLLATKRVHTRYTPFSAPHMQLAGLEVDIIPPQGNKLAGA